MHDNLTTQPAPFCHGFDFGADLRDPLTRWPLRQTTDYPADYGMDVLTRKLRAAQAGFYADKPVLYALGDLLRLHTLLRDIRLIGGEDKQGRPSLYGYLTSQGVLDCSDSNFESVLGISKTVSNGYWGVRPGLLEAALAHIQLHPLDALAELGWQDLPKGVKPAIHPDVRAMLASFWTLGSGSGRRRLSPHRENLSRFGKLIDGHLQERGSKTRLARKLGVAAGWVMEAKSGGLSRSANSCLTRLLGGRQTGWNLVTLPVLEDFLRMDRLALATAYHASAIP